MENVLGWEFEDLRMSNVELFCDEDEVLGDNWIDDLDYDNDSDDEVHLWDIYDNRVDKTSMKNRIKRGY